MDIKGYVKANLWKIVACYLMWVLAFVVIYNNSQVTEAYNTAYKAGCWNSFVDLQNKNYAIVNGVMTQRNDTIPTTIMNITPG